MNKGSPTVAVIAWVFIVVIIAFAVGTFLLAIKYVWGALLG